jgi:hypothetical protein
VARARHFAHSKWAWFYAQNSSWAGLRNCGPPFGAANWRVFAANWRAFAAHYGPAVLQEQKKTKKRKISFLFFSHPLSNWYIHSYMILFSFSFLVYIEKSQGKGKVANWDFLSFHLFKIITRPSEF